MPEAEVFRLPFRGSATRAEWSAVEIDPVEVYDRLLTTFDDVMGQDPRPWAVGFRLMDGEIVVADGEMDADALLDTGVDVFYPSAMLDGVPRSRWRACLVAKASKDLRARRYVPHVWIGQRIEGILSSLKWREESDPTYYANEDVDDPF